MKFKRTGDLELAMATLPQNYKKVFGEEVSKELMVEIIEDNIAAIKLKWLTDNLTDSNTDLLEYKAMLEMIKGNGNV